MSVITQILFLFLFFFAFHFPIGTHAVILASMFNGAIKVLTSLSSYTGAFIVIGFRTFGKCLLS